MTQEPVRITEDLVGRAIEAISNARLDDAATYCARALVMNPVNSEAWLLQSEVALRRGDMIRALESADKAISVQVEADARFWTQKARCHALLDDFNAARAAAARAEISNNAREEDFVALGALLVRCDFHADAKRCFESALRCNSDNLEAWRGMAAVQRFLGDLEGAEAATDIVLARNPFDGELQNIRSSLRKQTRSHNHTEALTRTLRANPPNWRDVVHIAYALAKEYEDLGEWDLSFQNLKYGADTRRRHTRYDVMDDIRIFDAIKAAFDAPLTSPSDACHEDTPIFVLGMPRTGTTLVERIITSHSQASSAGEPNDFATQMLRLIKATPNGSTISRLELPRAALGLKMREWGEAYVEALRHRASAPKIIDKLPLNFLYVGYIHLALPNARIVHVRRHPMDACYAMYKFLFSNAYPFSYDLRELGEYYAAYSGLIEHWRRVLPPGRLIEIDYEDLIEDQDGQTRRLIAALGLEWEDSCLRFYQNQAASTTGSASQVRNPIYNQSVGKWRRFEAHLRPLAKTLRNRGIGFSP